MQVGQKLFSGERPRFADHLRKGVEARFVRNCDLSHGDLRPYRAHKRIQNFSRSETLKSLYHWKTKGLNYWIADPDELDFARSPVAGELHDRVYFTGKSEPRVLTTSIPDPPHSNFDFTTDYYKLGVPAPTSALTLGGSYTTGSHFRAYLYTYVVKLGTFDAEEGVNSAIASISDYGSGDVELSLFISPPAKRSIGKIRIYRISSSASGASEFRLVDEFDTEGVDFSTFTFTDDIEESALGGTLTTANWTPPPADLKGIIGIKNGSLAGFAGNRVYFSEPFLPHAWPYSYPVDSEVIGLGLIGSTIIVLTDEQPYLMEGQPELVSQQKLVGRYPCIAGRGIVSCEVGVFYPSDEGIALVTYNGIVLYSYEYLDRFQYKENYSPTTVKAAYYGGKYIAFNGGGGFVIDTRDKTLSEITDPSDASAVHYSLIDNELYFIAFGDDSNQNALYQFQGNTAQNTLEYTYRSNDYVLPSVLNLSCARIIPTPEAVNNAANIAANAAAFAGATGDGAVNSHAVNEGGAVNFDFFGFVAKKTYGVVLYFYGDGELLLTKTITDGDPFRLPADTLYRRCFYELVGDFPMAEIVFATSMDELD